MVNGVFVEKKNVLVFRVSKNFLFLRVFLCKDAFGLYTMKYAELRRSYIKYCSYRLFITGILCHPETLVGARIFGQRKKKNFFFNRSFWFCFCVLYVCMRYFQKYDPALPTSELTSKGEQQVTKATSRNLVVGEAVLSTQSSETRSDTKTEIESRSESDDKSIESLAYEHLSSIPAQEAQLLLVLSKSLSSNLHVCLT